MKSLARGALVVVAIAAAACRDRPPVRAVAAAPSPSSSPSSCEGCHAEIAAEWRASFHRAAFTDDTFQRSLALEEPKEHPFCNGCHAPSSAGVAAGVDCRSCHGGPGAPHAESAKGTNTCATCHEFTFDHGRSELVQKTVSEHAASPWASVSCVECHMPAKDGHKDHRFLAGHAPDRIARAVHVEVARGSGSGPNTLRVAIRVDAGHAFPTGDMFRRARLVVFAEGARGEIVADAERVFGRTWGGIRGGEHAGARTEETDTRIRGESNDVLTLEDPPRPIARVRWSLLYERVIAVRGPHVTIASSDAIAEGTLDW